MRCSTHVVLSLSPVLSYIKDFRMKAASEKNLRNFLYGFLNGCDFEKSMFDFVSLLYSRVNPLLAEHANLYLHFFRPSLISFWSI
jgi:hypothetical protein